MSVLENATGTSLSIEDYALQVAGFGFELIISFAAAIVMFFCFMLWSGVVAKDGLRDAGGLLFYCSVVSIAFRVFTL